MTIEAHNFKEHVINLELNLSRYELDNQRLEILANFTRSFIPRLGPVKQEGYNAVEVELPENISTSRDETLVAAFDEIKRICSR